MADQRQERCRIQEGELGRGAALKSTKLERCSWLSLGDNASVTLATPPATEPGARLQG
jgi:hypothetical protein